MKHTVQQQRRATGFQVAGETFYLLHEKVPGGGKWNCIAVGRFASVIKRVCFNAALTANGSRVDNFDSVTPDFCIGSWLGAMKRATIQEDFDLVLSISDTVLETIPYERKVQARQLAVAAGHAELFSKIVEEGALCGLYRHASLLEAIFGGEGMVSPEKFFLVPSNHGCVLADTTLQPARASESIVVAKVMQLTQEHYLVDFDGSGWHVTRTPVADFVEHKAWEHEVAEPGSSVSAIHAFREAIRGAGAVTTDTLVTVVPITRSAKQWSVTVAKRLAKKLVAGKSCDSNIGSYAATLASIVAADGLSDLLVLDASQVVWHFEAEGEGSFRPKAGMDIAIAA